MKIIRTIMLIGLVMIVAAAASYAMFGTLDWNGTIAGTFAVAVVIILDSIFGNDNGIITIEIEGDDEGR